MPLPNNDPSLPSNPAPIFNDTEAVRGDQLRAAMQLIWGNLQYLFDFTGRTTDTLTEGPTNLYFTAARAITALAPFMPPVGSILAWHKSLPGVPALLAGGYYVECNGQTLSDSESPLNGQVIPNLNGHASGANSPTIGRKAQMFLRGATTSGTGQEHAFQGHWHAPTPDGIPASQSSGGGGGLTGSAYPTASNPIRDPISDGVNGTPKTANETRPVNMSVVWIMRVK